MSGLFSTLNTAVKGLNAQQTALQTASNNISNAGTDGYSRQRVELKEDISTEIAGVGRIGTGVKLEGVVRTVDDLVDNQIRNENSTLSQYTTKDDVMGQLESVFNETSGTGVSSAMGDMFTAWQDLSSNPESSSAKSVVVQDSMTFTDTLNQKAAQLNQLKDDTVSSLEKNTYDVNSTVDQLKAVNDQIFNFTIKGESPNDLLDKRDLLMKNLSGLANYTSSFDKWGRASITLGGRDITAADATYKLSTVSEMFYKDDGSADVKIAVGGDITNIKEVNISADAAKNIKAGSPVYYDENASEPVAAAAITSGAIGGNLMAMDEIDARAGDLNSFTKSLADLINSKHNTGTDGIDFFTFKDISSNYALNISVNPKLQEDESLVLAGGRSTSEAGDGSTALAISNLKDMKMSSGATLEESYSNIVAKVGISTQNAANMVDTHKAVMEQLQSRRDSVSGVSIDEETANIIQYQRSYEANAKVISVLSDMLDTLINKTGV